MVGRAGDNRICWAMCSEQLGCRKNEQKPVRDLFHHPRGTRGGSSTASSLMMHIEGRGKEWRVKNRVQHDIKDWSN